MSDRQWARDDGGRRGSCRQPQLLPARRHHIEKVFGHRHTVLCAPGPRAEQPLYPEPQRRGAKQPVFLSNFHFDTTKLHIELAGARALNALTKEALDTATYHDWKGNFDLEELARLIETHGAANVVALVATVTCNTQRRPGRSRWPTCARPRNSRARRRHPDGDRRQRASRRTPVFIREREAGQAQRGVPDIVRT